MTYAFDANGGFFAADVDAEIIEYAYPTSEHAVAARRNPDRVASEMIEPIRDHLGYYRSMPWFAERFSRMSQQMLVPAPRVQP